MADEIVAAQLVVKNHELGLHGGLEDRLAECERILGELGLDIGALRGELTAHADEEIELIEVEVEDSDGAQVDIDAPEAEAESGDAESESSGESAG